MIKGNLRPYEFFETKGVGESALEIHAGSYHMALNSAGISDYNILTYSSVLPKDAILVDRTKLELMPPMPFGSELKCIMGVCNAEESEQCSAGVVYGWLYDGDEKIGGLACEVSGNYPEDELLYRLEQVIRELHIATYSQYSLEYLKYITSCFVPQKRYGTALAALCFVSYKEN